MGNITSRSQNTQIQKERKEDDFIDKENMSCDFCGNRARQIITKHDQTKVKACFTCIPKHYYRIPWILDKEMI